MVFPILNRKSKKSNRLRGCLFFNLMLKAELSRHQSEVATWGRLPGAVHCFVHCSGHCLDTVHGHCSQ